MDQRRATFQAIGTHWELRVAEALTDRDWQQLRRRIDARIEAFDKAYSRFRSDSLVTEMARRAGRHALPEDGFRLLSVYEQLYRATDGRVTPLIGQTLADAGYDAEYSFRSKPLHAPPRWEDVMEYDRHSLTLRQPALLDFGAAGKGYLVDIIGELLGAAGLQNYTVDAGGDILHRATDNRTLRVGLENPLDQSEVVAVATIANQSLCASAGSKRRWADFTHVIDPVTLQSPRRVLATWVVADDTLTADGVATALFLVSPQQLQRAFAFSYALLDAEMGLHYSKTFPLAPFEAPS